MASRAGHEGAGSGRGSTHVPLPLTERYRDRMCDGTAVGKCFVKIHGAGAASPDRGIGSHPFDLERFDTCRAPGVARPAEGPRRLPSQTGSRRCPTILAMCGLSRRPCATRRADGRQPSGWRWSPSSRSAGAGGASSGGIALGRSGLPRRLRAGRRRGRGRHAPVGSAAAPGDRLRRRARGRRARLVRLDRLVADARRRPTATPTAGSWRRPRRPAAHCSRASCAARSRPPCGCSAPPRCRSSPTPSSSGRTACSSRPRRGCRACSAIPTRSAPTPRSRRPAALWLASAPQRARRVAGCATLALLVLGLGARLLARRACWPR